MKIRTISFYGDNPMGAVLEVDDAEGARLIELKGVIAYEPTDTEAANDADAAKVAAEAASKKQTK